MPTIETLGFQVTASASLVAATMLTGDSNVTRSFKSSNPDGSKNRCIILDAWTDLQLAGQINIMSPRMHDNSVGILMNDIKNSTTSLLRESGQWQTLYSQDALTLQLAGSGVAGDFNFGFMTLFYDNLGGINSMLINQPILRKYGTANLTNVSISMGSVAGSAGTWQTATAINAATATQALKDNTYYAVKGITSTVQAGAVSFRGVNTGNVRLAVPANPSLNHITSSYFVRLSNLYGLSCIPVFNTANAGNTLVEVVQDENAATTVVNLHLVELSQNPF